jgi:hypothetical protein
LDVTSLPDDPEEAFVEFERKARARLEEIQDESWLNELDYMSAVLGAAKAFGIEALASLELPDPNGDVAQPYHQFKMDVGHCIVQLRIHIAHRAKRNTVAFNTAAKIKLRHLLNEMRTVVDNEQRLTPRKREALWSKIAALSAEVSLCSSLLFRRARGSRWACSTWP